jgi:hypothetical protein
VTSLFGCGPRPPAEAVQRARLGRGEKVLAHAEAGDGSWLLGTRDAFLVVSATGATRIPWEQVETADWDRDTDRLRVAEVGEFGEPRPVHTFGIAQPGDLLQLIRERVTASVVLQRRVEIRDGAGLTILARRPSRGTGEITWAYELDPGLDPADPEVREAAAAGLRAARDELGPEQTPI